MIDSGAQPSMIGKKLAQELGLTVVDLVPCPFTIVTSIRGTNQATSYTKQPLQLILCIGPRPLTHICCYNVHSLVLPIIIFWLVNKHFIPLILVLIIRLKKYGLD